MNNLQSNIKKLSYYFKAIENKNGLEIGGPSSIFNDNDVLPIYALMNNLDGCNFNTNTVWEGNILAGQNYKFHPNKPLGYQYINEATQLPINSSKYDVVLASHCLEHIANPIKAMKEWSRVLNRKGKMIIVLPYKEMTFDHNRSITDFSDLIRHEKDNTDETDLSHLEEILQLHDLTLDPLAGNKEQFKERSLQNYTNRCLHQHVFDETLMSKLCKYINMKIKEFDLVTPFHQIFLCEK